jgi:bla regulator protein BlaR1
MLSIAFLLDAAAKATVILAAAWLPILAMRVVHRGSAAARYFTWTCALGAALAVPLISPFLSRWGVPVKTPALASAGQEVSTTEGVPALAPVVSTANAKRAMSGLPIGPATIWLAIVWLVGAIVMLARVAIGHLRLAVSLRRAPEVRAPEWIAARGAAADQIGLRGAVKLRRSAETDVPLTGGVFAATVMLPETADEWSAEQRRIVLLHELTHARRRDPLLWLLAQVAVALYWFHPLAWLAAARFRREQERSCDDAVVRAGTDGSVYAAQLVELARSATNAGAYVAALTIAASSDLEQRVRALLDGRANRNGLSRRVCWAAATAVLVALIPLAALRG